MCGLCARECSRYGRDECAFLSANAACCLARYMLSPTATRAEVLAGLNVANRDAIAQRAIVLNRVQDDEFVPGLRSYRA